MFDVGSAGYKMNEFKQELYDKSGIGIPHEDIETNDVAIFGWDNFFPPSSYVCICMKMDELF